MVTQAVLKSVSLKTKTIYPLFYLSVLQLQDNDFDSFLSCPVFSADVKTTKMYRVSRQT